MSRVEVYPVMPAPQPGRVPSLGVAILIEVPAVKAPRIRPAAMRRGGLVGRPSARRPRRRLRRELRLAGWVVLALAPLASGGALGWGSLASRAVDRPVGNAVASTGNRGEVAFPLEPNWRAGEVSAGSLAPPSVVVLSIEPVVGAPAADAEVPIIFPGYVLPDDSLEEPAHEGS
jgi:hypothetical protein